MPGVNIGGASYTLSLDDRAFIDALRRAEQQANASQQALRGSLSTVRIGVDGRPLASGLAQSEQAAATSSDKIRSSLASIGTSARETAGEIGGDFVRGFALRRRARTARRHR
jgi:hypothetical protein